MSATNESVITTESFTTSTWLQEFHPYVNDVRVRWPDLMLNLVEGQTCTLKLDYEYSWLIGVPGAFLVLDYVPGMEGQGLTCDPPLGQAMEMSEGTTSLSWTISIDQMSTHDFALQFSIPRIEDLPKSPTVPGRTLDIAQEVEVIFDEFPMTFGTSTAYPCQGAKHTIAVRPTASSALLDKPVGLLLDGETIEKFGVRITPALKDAQPLSEGG